MNLNWVFQDYGIEIQVAIIQSGLRVSCQFYQNAYATKRGGLIIAMYPGDHVCLAPQHNTNSSREYYNVSNGIVIAGKVNGSACEIPLTLVTSNRWVLPQEGVWYEGLVAFLD